MYTPFALASGDHPLEVSKHHFASVSLLNPKKVEVKQ